jgi:hypothetical protein
MANRRNYSYAQRGYQYSYDKVTGNLVAVFSDPNALQGYRNQNDNRRAKPVGRYIKPTAYVMSEWSNSHAVGSFYSSQPTGNRLVGTLTQVVLNPTSLRNTYMAGGTTIENFDGALSNRAIQKARNALKAQKVNLGQAFAERRQVSSQMLQTAKKLECAIHTLRRGNFNGTARCLGVRTPKQTAKTLAGQWLGYKYGWQPLLSDIHGAVLALEAKDPSEWMVTARGTATSTFEDHGIYGNAGSANAHLANHRIKKGCYVRIDAVPASPGLATAASLGLTNPALLAWELLPLSFVADWFVPVGDYLTQLDSTVGWDIKGYSQSDLVQAHYNWRGRTTSTTAGGGTTYFNSWSSSRKFVALNRSVASSVPFPILPWIKDPITASNVKNALALLVQAFG